MFYTSIVMAEFAQTKENAFRVSWLSHSLHLLKAKKSNEMMQVVGVLYYNGASDIWVFMWFLYKMICTHPLSVDNIIANQKWEQFDTTQESYNDIYLHMTHAWKGMFPSIRDNWTIGSLAVS